MRRLVLLIFIAALGMLQASFSGGAARADSVNIQIEAVVWQIDRDYPGAEPNDVNLPIRTVYIKTHDGTDWMSRYDPNPRAVSGPDALRNLIRDYSYQGINVVAWFVPYGTDIEGQLTRAREVIDSGVTALVADVEPYSGFCNNNCAMLAEQFWKTLRAQRPSARLGVTYDARTQWLAPAAIPTWLSVADFAAPECYWESFAGQGPWGDPGTCLLQAHADLLGMTPGRNVEFAPMLQGSTSGPRMRVALDTALSLGATRASLWRRGVVPAGVWSEIKAYVGEIDRPCWVTRSDNCLLQEPVGPVWLLQGGARFGVSSPEALHSLGYDFTDVRPVPAGFTDLLSVIPRDGTLLQEVDVGAVHVVYAGGLFGIPSPDAFNSIGLEWSAIRTLPAGGLAQVPGRPVDYNRFREVGEPSQFIIVKGKKVQLNATMLDLLLEAGRGHQMYTLWDGALDAVPDIVLRRGDASCDGDVNAVDALRLLQTTAGIPNFGVCVGLLGNVDCDGDADAIDALLVLRYVAGVGDETPTPTPTPEPSPTPTPGPSATPGPSPSPRPSRFPTPGPMPTPTPYATDQPQTPAALAPVPPHSGRALSLADPSPTPEPSATPSPTTGCPAIGSALDGD